MNNENEIPIKIKPKQEHIAINEASSQKISYWLEQVASKKKGVKISRKDFINWLIEKSPENLSNGDLSSLVEIFYDEAAFLRGLLRDLKQAKIEGRSASGFELILKTKKTDTKKEIIESEVKDESDNLIESI